MISLDNDTVIKMIIFSGCAAYINLLIFSISFGPINPSEEYIFNLNLAIALGLIHIALIAAFLFFGTKRFALALLPFITLGIIISFYSLGFLFYTIDPRLWITQIKQGFDSTNSEAINYLFVPVIYLFTLMSLISYVWLIREILLALVRKSQS